MNDEYPYHLGDDWDYGYRAARIVELLEAKLADGPVSAADLVLPPPAEGSAEVAARVAAGSACCAFRRS